MRRTLVSLLTAATLLAAAGQASAQDPSGPPLPVAPPPASGATGATGVAAAGSSGTTGVAGVLPPVVVPAPGPTGPTGPTQPTGPPLVTTATVAGTTARLRPDGKAAIPRGAPQQVRAIIAAANQIVGKPYKWGGGHAKLVDRGYDCSGAVSYALVRAGLLSWSRDSTGLAAWGAIGPGRWVAVYANADHAYLEVAGLRLDTSPVADPWDGRQGVRWRPVIGRREHFHARHPLGL